MKPRNRQTADLVYADEVPVGGTSIEDIDLEHFTTFFAKQFGEPLDDALDKAGLSLDQLLNNLGLAREATLNLAGLLIFGRHPQRHRETNKKLLLRHIEESVPAGTRMAELLQVLPGLSRNQVFGLLSELRDKGRVHVGGQRRWARWLPVAMARREDEAAAANESKEEA